jgi:signal transduction histidine kinase
MKQALTREGVELVVSVPLMAKGRLVGAIQLGAREVRSFAPEELSLLAAIGQQVGMAVENARLYEQAQQSATYAERSRLARELHDSVTQSLYSLTLYAEAAARMMQDGEHAQAANALREMRDTAQEALREMRLLIFQLRPPALEKSGLAAALQARLDAVETRGGIRAKLVVEGVSGAEQLPLLVQEELYHIAQEALNNALKHAHPRQVRVGLRFNLDAVHLEISDDGAGFALESIQEGGGLGLPGMRERAERIGADLRIESAPGQGTQVLVRAPHTPKTEEAR